MALRYYNAERARERMPEYKGTDEELQSAMDEISLLYNSAIRQLETKLEILSDDFEKNHSYMPIHHIQSRLKTFDSILDKAARYGIEDPINNLDVVLREVLDIAGVRVICNYEEDIETMSSLLLRQEDVELIRVKDYIANPKASGYRSLHAVVSLPIYLVNTRKIIPVEVQFRSVAMDAWASLEHELRYKNKGNLSDEIQDELKECAETLHNVDQRLSRIRNEVIEDANEYTEY